MHRSHILAHHKQPDSISHVFDGPNQTGIKLLMPGGFFWPAFAGLRPVFHKGDGAHELGTTMKHADSDIRQRDGLTGSAGNNQKEGQGHPGTLK